MSRISFREIERQDIPTINAWRNDRSIVEWLGANFLFIAQEIDDGWYDSYLRNRQEAVRLAILHPEADALVGCVNLTGIHRINRTAEYSIVIGDRRFWSRGVGEAATRRILEHAFADLNLNRVYLYVLAENDRAIRLYRKVGFRDEGTLKEAVFKGGRFHDMHLMAVCASEWDGMLKSGRT